MLTPFDALVDDLRALRAARSRRREQALTARRERQARAARQVRILKAITATPPLDLTEVQRDLDQMQKADARHRERQTVDACRETLAQLDQAAKAGRLTGIQAGKLDALKGRYGAQLAKAHTPPTDPNTVSRQIDELKRLMAAYSRQRSPDTRAEFRRLFYQIDTTGKRSGIHPSHGAALADIRHRASAMGLLGTTTTPPRAA